jgi:NAD(P)-dependent dehydrogenase (short-subunit alcohol dehydrogenase family)
LAQAIAKKEHVMTTLIIGANSEIAKSLAQHVINNTSSKLIIVSRHVDFYNHEMFNNITVIQVDDYQESSISDAVSTIKEAAITNISNVFICHGILHNQRCQPEKRLEDFSASAFTEILSANTITPMLWLKHLTPILKGKQPCKLVIFTARVGSISDNELGGWYSYRASKAALNMLIKSAAVEYARRAKNIKIISFHPGTTDSPLSKPFQKNVPEGKLFTSDFVASQLVNITKATNVDGQASFLDWQGKEIPW